jgi:hypothetical protein
MFMFRSMNATPPLPNLDDLPQSCGSEGYPALKDEILGELSFMRGIMLGFARQLQIEAEPVEPAQPATDEEQAEKPDLPRLAVAAVHVARAHRQISVLQLEIIGEREPAGRRAGGGQQGQAQARADGRIPTPDNPPRKRWRSPAEQELVDRWYPAGYPYANGDYNDYDIYTDRERDECEDARQVAMVEKLVAAMDEDFTAAGRADICREAPCKKVQLILALPHPATDRCVAAMAPGDVYWMFEPEHVEPLKLGAGPPGALEAYDARRREFGPPEGRIAKPDSEA